MKQLSSGALLTLCKLCYDYQEVCERKREREGGEEGEREGEREGEKEGGREGGREREREREICVTMS